MIDPRAALRRYPLLALLPDAWLDAWLATGQTQAIDAGQTLLQIGMPGTDLFLILSGKVRVLRTRKNQREIAVAVHRPGEIFGEYALLDPGLNTATCRGAETGRVLRLPLAPLKEQLQLLLAGRSRLKKWLRLHYLLAHLRDQACLGFMSAHSFLPLLDHLEIVRFCAGNTLQAEGFHDDRWFVLRAGRAIIGADTDSRPGRVLGPGDCFGEAALLDSKGLPTVQAVSDLDCHMLRRDRFEPGAEASRPVSIQTALSSLAAPIACLEWVPQQQENDCGAAALAMAARVLGRPIAAEDLRAQMRFQEKGASLEELHRLAIQLQFRSQAIRIGLDHLAAVRLPAIAHLASGHYVVLFEVAAGGLLVGDPAHGISKWPLASLHKNWTGHLLLVS